MDGQGNFNAVGTVPGTHLAWIDFQSPEIGYVIFGCNDDYSISAATFEDNTLILQGQATGLHSIPLDAGWHSPTSVRIGNELFETTTNTLTPVTGANTERGPALGVSPDGRYRYFRASQTPYCADVPPERQAEKFDFVESITLTNEQEVQHVSGGGTRRIVFGPNNLVASIIPQRTCQSAILYIGHIDPETGLYTGDGVAWSQQSLGTDFSWFIQDDYGYRNVPDAFVFEPDGAIRAWQHRSDGTIVIQTKTYEELIAASQPKSGE